MVPDFSFSNTATMDIVINLYLTIYTRYAQCTLVEIELQSQRAYPFYLLVLMATLFLKTCANLHSPQKYVRMSVSYNIHQRQAFVKADSVLGFFLDFFCVNCSFKRLFSFS